MAVIEISGLTKRYGARRGVDGVSLAVPEGSIYGFLGPNGAGKTTTIRVLLGLLRPSAGTARILGHNCWQEPALAKAQIGYLPGDLRLYPWLTAESALRMVGRVRRRELLGHGRDLADRFGLEMGLRVRRMSRGTRQKLGLVLAMAHRPRVLILDEPTGGLDPLMQDVLHEELRRLASAGHTVFFSSHTLAEVQRLCDRVAIVREGRIVADGTLESLRQRAGSDVVIQWKAGAGPGSDPPACLRLQRRDERRWEGALHGPVSALLEWLGPRSSMVEELRIAEPELEGLFRRFYGAEGGGE